MGFGFNLMDFDFRFSRKIGPIKMRVVTISNTMQYLNGSSLHPIGHYYNSTYIDLCHTFPKYILFAQSSYIGLCLWSEVNVIATSIAITNR